MLTKPPSLQVTVPKTTPRSGGGSVLITDRIAGVSLSVASGVDVLVQIGRRG
jgi:hypothetical protein